MTDTEVIAGNKLIAAFMSAPTDLNGVYHYHHSWNILMPVVEKIAIEYDVSIRWFDKDCITTISNTSMEGTEIADFGNYTPAITNIWLAIVKLIKYKNSQK